MPTKLFDSSIVETAEQALDFIGNILGSSTEYSIVGKDLDGKILLWNEGARRLYGYEPDEVVGKLNSSILHVPEDVKSGKHREIMDAALARRLAELQGGTLEVASEPGKGSTFTLRLPSESADKVRTIV